MFPAGLTRIGDNAFFGCESLTTVVLPAGLKTIGYQSFRCCSSLKNVALPAGLKIDDEAFRNTPFDIIMKEVVAP